MQTCLYSCCSSYLSCFFLNKYHKFYIVMVSHKYKYWYTCFSTSKNSCHHCIFSTKKQPLLTLKQPIICVLILLVLGLLNTCLFKRFEEQIISDTKNWCQNISDMFPEIGLVIRGFNCCCKVYYSHHQQYFILSIT